MIGVYEMKIDLRKCSMLATAATNRAATDDVMSTEQSTPGQSSRACAVPMKISS